MGTEAIERLSTVVIGCVAAVFVLLLGGCVYPTKAWAVRPCSPSGLMEGESSVHIQNIRFEGSLQRRREGLHDSFLAGFSRPGPEIKAVTQPEACDAVLDVVIDTRYSSTGASKCKWIPGYGGMWFFFSGGILNFNWYADASYVLRTSDGEVLVDGECRIKAVDSMAKVDFFDGFFACFLGAWYVQLLYYPDGEARDVLGDEILACAGQEIGKRLRCDQAASYFVARAKARDGMDAWTYAQFLAKKKRLAKERARSRAERQEGLQATVGGSDAVAAVGSTLVVFGVGVDEYQHYPRLRYAARDCRRVVELFKSRYGLSEDRAMVLTNDDATAAKVTRFISRNAAELLDEDDTFVFYFSGHGAPDVDAASADVDGLRKYLLLANSEPDVLPLTAVSLDSLAALLRKLPCRRVIVLLDSCFAGTAGKGTLARLKGLGGISDMAYANMATVSGKGRVIMAACSENEVSQERDDIEAGVFTHALIEGLRGKADANGNGRVDILELFDHIGREVSMMTNDAQTPVFRGALDRNIEF